MAGNRRQGDHDEESKTDAFALRSLAAAGIGIASASSWVQTLSALATEQAHLHAGTAGASQAAWSPRVLTTRQNETVTTLCELIIPQTDTPGAKDALVNRFVDSVLRRRSRRSERLPEGFVDTRAARCCLEACSPHSGRTYRPPHATSSEDTGEEQKSAGFFQAPKP